MGLEEILRDFIEWNNENYNEGYIPNSRLGRYLMEKQCEGKETSDEKSNCIKPDVNQQSEQLLAFAEYIKTKTLTSLIGEPQHYVDRFLKANNCG